MRLFVGLLLAFFAAIPLHAQTLSGRVVDSISGEPLPYANASLFSLPDSSLVQGQQTDTLGKFRLSDFGAGRFYLEISFMGFRRKKHELSFGHTGNRSLGTVKLSPSEQMINEVQIRGEKVGVAIKADRKVFQAQDFAASQSGNAGDLLQNLPGVQQDALGNLQLRGASFQLLLNGSPTQMDPMTLLNQLPAGSIEEIEIITSPSARYDPEGKGGIINVITKKDGPEGLFMEVSSQVGLPSIEPYDNQQNPARYGGQLTLTYRKGPWNLAFGANGYKDDIAGRRVGDVWTERGDSVRTRFPSRGERSFDRHRYGGNFSASYQFNDQHRLKIATYGGIRRKFRTADILYYNNHRTRLNDGQTFSQFQYFNENLRERLGDFFISSVDYTFNSSAGHELSVSGLYEYTLLGGPTENINRNPSEPSQIFQLTESDNRTQLHGVRLKVNHRFNFSEHSRLDMGYQYRYLDHQGDFDFRVFNQDSGRFIQIPQFSSDIELNRPIHSLYGNYSGEKGRFSYGGGVRAEFMDRSFFTRSDSVPFKFELFTLFPSAFIGYNLGNDYQLKMSYARKIERTTTFKMNPFPEREHSETFEQGDPRLRPEFINTVELSLEKTAPWGSVAATAFHRATDQVINRVNTVFNDTILNRIYTNAGEATATGIELGGEVEPFPFWKSYLSFNGYRFRQRGQLFGERFVFDTEAFQFTLNTTQTFQLPREVELQVALNYLSAHKTAQGEDSRFYNPSLTLSREFLDGKLNTTFQWLSIDMGLLNSNEQSITTRGDNFFTTTNYIKEVDRLMLSVNYQISGKELKPDFVESEFGQREF